MLRIVRWAVGVLLGLGLAGQAAAGDSIEVSSLKGLTGVKVSVYINCSRPEFQQLADSAGLQTKLELALRRSGIPVLGAVEITGNSIPGFLRLTLVAVSVQPESSLGDHGEPLSYGISLHLGLSQFVWTDQAKDGTRQYVLGETWSDGGVLVHGTSTLKSGSLKNIVSDLADKFANDWLKSREEKKP